MQRFRFQLETVLEWRRTQFDVEESKLQKLFSERAAIEAHAAVVERSQTEGREAVKVASAPAAERAAIDAYLRWVRFEKKRIANLLADCDQRIAQQRATVIAARRNCDLLERLKAKRHAEWSAQFEKELEQFAAEAYLAKIARK